MAPSNASSTASEDDEPVYPAGLSKSLAGLPVRLPGGGTIDPTESSSISSTRPDAGRLTELDLATTRGTASDISSKLEQKRLEYERQRAEQKKAFEEQMKQLELQQEREERELLERGGDASEETPAAAAPTPSTIPVRSRSGNDLVGFNSTTSENGDAKEKKKTDFSNARSMPGSRRHSGEVKEGVAAAAVAGGPDGVRKKGPQGEPMLNSFLFDDELEADLQNSAWGGKYLQMNTDDDKFPILVRRDSYPGILSASSAALDLAPLSQTASHAQRSTSGPGRPGASEWPQFQNTAAGKPTESPVNGASGIERHRSVTHGGASDPSSPAGGERASPRPARTGAGQLPPPRSSLQTASGRSSPVIEKKLGGLENGLGKPSLVKGYSNSDLAQISSPAQGYVDTMTEQFSN
ncbi:pumilio RNA binding protein, partial [Pseudohyphozyma bogoriensis]